MRTRKGRSAPFSLFAFQDIITSVTGIMILITMMLALEVVVRKASSPEVQTQQIVTQLSSAITQNEGEIKRLQALIDESAEAVRYDSETLKSRLQDIQNASEELEKQNQNLANALDSALAKKAELHEQSLEFSPEVAQQLAEQLKETQEEIQNLKESNRVIFNKPEGESKTPWLVEISGTEIQTAETGRSMKPLSFPDATGFETWAVTQNPGNVYFVLLIKPSGVLNYQILRESIAARGFDIGSDLLQSEQTALDPEKGAGRNEP